MALPMWRIGPAALAGIAVAIALAVFFPPPTETDLGPLDLRTGAVTSGVFKANYTELYEIGVKLDQRTAARLWPCQTDISWFVNHRNACGGDQRPEWPIVLSLRLSSGGVDMSALLKPDTSTGGGTYLGAESFIRTTAYAELKGGRTYRLAARSLKDATSTQVAHPRLVAMVATPGFLEELAVNRLLGGLAAVVLLLIAVGWAVSGWLRTRPAAAEAAAASA